MPQSSRRFGCKLAIIDSTKSRQVPELIACKHENVCTCEETHSGAELDDIWHSANFQHERCGDLLDAALCIVRRAVLVFPDKVFLFVETEMEDIYQQEIDAGYMAHGGKASMTVLIWRPGA